ncbi:hypothetical protein [Sporosarcina sp. FSL K6-3457]|uniref:hypothetical protein n=1 Tax=Sporosarcina sp. FSL K6-3457 TaxID=2978204 RepID=UPI0030FC37BB
MEKLLKQVMTELQGFRQEVNNKFEQVDRRFDVMDDKFEQVDKRFDAVDQRFDGVDQRLEQLEQGQVEIKDTRHSATLKTENFTAIRQEMREKIVDTQADVNLLFNLIQQKSPTSISGGMNARRAFQLEGVQTPC